MKQNDFKIVFDSPPHEVDIETLIGCLMHTSNIIQEVNRNIKSDKKIEVKIKALDKGSFEIHIELVEKLIQSLFSNNAVQYSAGIVTIVGGLYILAKFLGGKKPERIESKEEKTIITNFTGNITSVENQVFNIYTENKTVRDNIAKQFTVLEENENIEGFKLRSKDIDFIIPREEFHLISKKIDISDDHMKEPITEIIHDRKILIIRPSFSVDLKWDFVYEGQKLSAKMTDEEMIKIIDNGEEFSKGDYMLADMEITKFYDSDLNTHLITKDSYKILKFKQHIKSEKQGKLF